MCAHCKRKDERAAAMIDGSKLGFRVSDGDEQPPAMVDLTQRILSDDWEKLGSQACIILSNLLPEFVDRYVAASLHYGDSNANVLGVRGQFADIWRKIGPLKRALWEGETLTREQPREILMDLIGHCLLTIEMIDRQDREQELADGKRDVPGHERPGIGEW